MKTIPNIIHIAHLQELKVAENLEDAENLVSNWCLAREGEHKHNLLIYWDVANAHISIYQIEVIMSRCLRLGGVQTL
jgi:hypothetical protein